MSSFTAGFGAGANSGLGQTRPVGQRSLTFVGGGVRSGKSAFAVALAKRVGPRRAFIATAELYDDEMRFRAEAHRAERAEDFTTHEVPRDVISVLRRVAAYDIVIIDCLTLWLSNLLLRGDDEKAIAAQVRAVVYQLRTAGPACIIVSNEVGMGIVPDSALGRTFRDVAGRAHQIVADAADTVYLAMMGLVFRAKPGPFEVVDGGSFGTASAARGRDGAGG